MAMKVGGVRGEETGATIRAVHHLEEALQNDEVAEIKYHIREAQHLIGL